MTRFERLVRIHQRLQAARPVSMRAFMEELHVSRTTIASMLSVTG